MAKPNKQKRKSSAAVPIPPYHLLDETKSEQDADGFLEGVARLLEGKKNIVVLVGAGISTSAGIPDFRSKDKGLYNTLDAGALGLSCPEDLFCIEFFKSNPVPFYRFAKHLYYPNLKNKTENSKKNTRSKRANSGLAVPSDSHKLLALLEERKMLLRVYTQNIDGLEAGAGVSDSKIVYCHGSLRSMSCTRCSKKNIAVNESILESIKNGSVPLCQVPLKKKKATKTKSKTMKTEVAAIQTTALSSPTRVSQRKRRRPSYREDDYILEEEEEDNTNIVHNGNNDYCCGGILKPAITFFGETLDNSVGRQIESDHSKADALIVIGTSLSVAPISKVIEYLPKKIPRILINRTIVHPKLSSGNNNHEIERDSEDEDFRKDYVFDAYILGFCDDITRALGKQLGLGTLANGAAKKRKTRNKNSKGTKSKLPQLLTQTMEQPSKNDDEDSLWAKVTVPPERVLLFPGALPTPVTTKKSTKKEEDEEKVCFQVHCDECSVLISTSKPVFNCSQCFDYDLCEACYPKKSKLHYGGRHTFCVK